MPDAHDLETRVRLLERALSTLLGTEDFEAFLAQEALTTTNHSVSTTHTEAPDPQVPLSPHPCHKPQPRHTLNAYHKPKPQKSPTPPPRRQAPPVR